MSGTPQEWGKLWAANRAVLDPIAPRHTRVMTGAGPPSPAPPCHAAHLASLDVTHLGAPRQETTWP